MEQYPQVQGWEHIMEDDDLQVCPADPPLALDTAILGGCDTVCT
jgi:hypothetical protein